MSRVHVEVVPDGIHRQALAVWSDLDLAADVSAILGDVVQCQRQSLDHLVFGLGQMNGPLSDRQAEDLAFPAHGRLLPPDGGSGLKHLGERHRAAIMRHVPTPDSQDPVHSDLILLNDLARIDRHRSIFVTAAGAWPGQWSFGNVTDFHLIGPQPAPADGSRAVIATWASGPNANLEMRGEVTAAVTFGDGPAAHQEVMPLLQQTMDACRTVCEDIERLLS